MQQPCCAYCLVTKMGDKRWVGAVATIAGVTTCVNHKHLAMALAPAFRAQINEILAEQSVGRNGGK